MATLALAGIPESITKDLKIKGFKIHELSGPVDYSVAHGRRDFYKIGLITGNMTLYYGDRLLEIRDTVLFFINPNIPHAIVRSSGKRSGYACLFTEAFVGRREWKEIVRDSQLFLSDGSPVISLNNDQAAFLTSLFQKMLSAYSSNYTHKDEFFKNCVELIIHEALRIQPRQNEPRYKNAATRMTNLFLDLLERQFPIDNMGAPLKLRTPQDFARSLFVHVNYLNRSVKEVTGKSTSVHISERIASEAKALLLYTDWSVADISSALGFAYPTYFNNYFKRVTGTTPNLVRKAKV